MLKYKILLEIITPISGDINIAPIITAVLFIFKPIEAINIAKIKIAIFVPFNKAPLSILSEISSIDALSAFKSNTSNNTFFN